jgi:sarcosine oxidase gamma subunit family protein
VSQDPYAFISPAAVAAEAGHRPVLRSPMEHAHLAAGATLESRDGWQLAVYPENGADLWLADVSHLGKLDLRGTAEELDALTGGLEPGHAREDGGVWTLRLTAIHGYVICPFGRVAELSRRIGPAAIDVTCGLAAVQLGGAAWREVWMRSSGVDARASRFPANRCLAGSVMRVPTLVVNQGDRVLMLVGWEYGEYFWDAILDAGATLGIERVSAHAAGVPEAVSA